jgi:hypothetical protein
VPKWRKQFANLETGNWKQVKAERGRVTQYASRQVRESIATCNPETNMGVDKISSVIGRSHVSYDSVTDSLEMVGIRITDSGLL